LDFVAKLGCIFDQFNAGNCKSVVVAIFIYRDFFTSGMQVFGGKFNSVEVGKEKPRHNLILLAIVIDCLQVSY